MQEITFKQFSRLMEKRRRTADDLVDLFRGKLDDSRNFFERVMSCRWRNPETGRYGLRDLGYVEGKNIVIEWRSAEGKLGRLPALATELVNLKVDVIVTSGPSATRPANEATSAIPIVMTQDPDPVRNGFVASLARPGGNITGLSSYSADLSGKRLELLKEIVPRLSRVAVLGTSTSPGNAQALTETEAAAGALGVKAHYLDEVPRTLRMPFKPQTKKKLKRSCASAAPCWLPIEHRLSIFR